MSCQTFVLSTGYKASNLKEFYEIIKIYEFLKDYIQRYDACVFSSSSFSKKDINIP